MRPRDTGVSRPCLDLPAMKSESALPSPGRCPPSRHSAPHLAIEVRGLVKRYGPKTAVDGLDLRVRTGAVTAVLGPNGAGEDHHHRNLRGLPPSG